MMSRGPRGESDATTPDAITFHVTFRVTFHVTFHVTLHVTLHSGQTGPFLSFENFPPGSLQIVVGALHDLSTTIWREPGVFEGIAVDRSMFGVLGLPPNNTFYHTTKVCYRHSEDHVLLQNRPHSECQQHHLLYSSPLLRRRGFFRTLYSNTRPALVLPPACP